MCWWCFLSYDQDVCLVVLLCSLRATHTNTHYTLLLLLLFRESVRVKS